jgi:hypothetical protein
MFLHMHGGPEVKVVQTFKLQRVDGVTAPPGPGGGGGSCGVCAPGPVVMMIHEGSCWVRREDGSREDLHAQSVVIWQPGEWVEYGSDDGAGYTIECYWANGFCWDRSSFTTPRPRLAHPRS